METDDCCGFPLDRILSPLWGFFCCWGLDTRGSRPGLKSVAAPRLSRSVILRHHGSADLAAVS